MAQGVTVGAGMSVGRVGVVGSGAAGMAPAGEVAAGCRARGCGRARLWVLCAAAVLLFVVGCGGEAAYTRAPGAGEPSGVGGGSGLAGAVRDSGVGAGSSDGGWYPEGGAGLDDAGPDGARGGVGAATVDGVRDPAGGADPADAVGDTPSAVDVAGDGAVLSGAVDSAGSDGEGVVLSEAVDSAGGDGDGALSGPADVVEPSEGTQPVPGAPGGGGAGDGAAADLPGPLGVQYEPGGNFFELGFRDSWPDRYDLDVFSDVVAVRADSVLVDGAVVRGLVQNMSERLFARRVTVSVGDSVWVFPLTVQPGEVAPFEIEGYRGPSDPKQIGFEVSAQLVPEPDPRRSFHVTESPGIWADNWDQVGYALQFYPHITRLEGVSGDDWVQAYETFIELREPTSHPSVADEVAGLVVEDLRVYLTKMDDHDRVLDVSEMTPYQYQRTDDGRRLVVPVRRADRNTYFKVVFLPNYEENFGITVGGVHDGA